ncbi:chloride channel protein [Arhodomonas sp. AD133]|uniref:chloride channel protein n=1 Tax=Arhodomonas sp. AD133 TaxID=3415009 RepID=UPI003EB6C303
MAADETEEHSSANSQPRSQARPLPDLVLFVLALAIGVVGGVGGIAFSAAISLIHNLFFNVQLSLDYATDAHIAPSVLGAAVILVPVVGSLIVTWIVNTLAPEARGHGVPEVLNAIYYQGGRIHPVVALAKAVASAVSIGTGGSVGREGPIVQIGATFGSVLGQLVRMPARQRVVLIGAGAAAGIAATFNAPIGGLAFAVELLLVSISARTVATVAMATVTATYIGRLYAGVGPSFNVPELTVFSDHAMGLLALALCIPLGIILGVASAGFIRSLYAMEDLFDRFIPNTYLRHATGMLGVGLLLYALLLYTGHYYVAGVGYATVIDALSGALQDPAFLALLFAAKLLATGLTIGSGASGGIFSPSLFLGATLGAAFGQLMAMLFPQAAINPAMFAVAGMAAMVGGTTGAVVTAITMIFEQTRDYGAMLPIITCVSLAYVVRMRLTPESIYTLKLARRGVSVPQGLQAAVAAVHTARTMMSRDFEIVDIDDLANWQRHFHPDEAARYTVVTRGDEVLGLARPELLYLLPDRDPETVVDRSIFPVVAQTTWPTIMRGLRAKNSELALVFSRRNRYGAKSLIGVITHREIARTAGASADLMD